MVVRIPTRPCSFGEKVKKTFHSSDLWPKSLNDFITLEIKGTGADCISIS